MDLTMTEPTLGDVLARADLIHDQPTLADAIARIGREIDIWLDGAPAVFLTVMQGALPFAGQLATQIRAPLLFDYVHATRYRGKTSGAELHWIKRPATSLAGATVLLVDDILDEGHTLVAIRGALMSFGPASLRVAVLAEKLHGRRASGAVAEFIGLAVPDRYVFGCGMDYKEYWRQLPAIYAVKDKA
jgi:hypoxanthine phosphoribosyltransferase